MAIQLEHVETYKSAASVLARGTKATSAANAMTEIVTVVQYVLNPQLNIQHGLGNARKDGDEGTMHGWHTLSAQPDFRRGYPP
jgi:hypothetical protein